jgi:hypothetical protein
VTLTFKRDLDPLDLELVERAIEDVSDTIRTNLDLESDEQLEAALRRELADMIRSTGVGDPAVLLDILMADLSDRYSTGPKV